MIVSIFIVNLRGSTTGMALTAVRWSEPAAKTIGVSVLQMKVVVAGVATGQEGQEGSILRYVFWHSLALAALVGLLVLFMAYVHL